MHLNTKINRLKYLSKVIHMSSNLDKLKALTSRLEEKLEEKATLFESTHEKANQNKKKPLEKSRKKTHDTKKNLLAKTSSDNVRKENALRIKKLYEKLKIFEKAPNFDNIFIYKAMNLSGIGLKEEDFAQVRDGKYIQIIAITYEADRNGRKKAKNISLRYFGKAEKLDSVLKNEIIEFVLRWRYEKAFQNVEHYKDLIAKVELPSKTLF